MGNSATGGNSAAWGVATATSPGMLSATAQDIAGVKSFVDGVQGPGTVPIGCMLASMPNIDAVNAWQPPASGVIKDGFMRADGTVITASHISQGCKLALNTALPNMIQRYPRGNTTSGATDGANTQASNVTLSSHSITQPTLSNHTLVAGNIPQVSTAYTPAGSVSVSGNKNQLNSDQQSHTHWVPSVNQSVYGSQANYDYVAVGSPGNSGTNPNTISLGSTVSWNSVNFSASGSLSGTATTITVGSLSPSSITHSLSTNVGVSDHTVINNAVNNEPAYIETIWVIRVK